jgi:hypothetical protein
MRRVIIVGTALLSDFPRRCRRRFSPDHRAIFQGATGWASRAQERRVGVDGVCASRWVGWHRSFLAPVLSGTGPLWVPEGSAVGVLVVVLTLLVATHLVTGRREEPPALSQPTRHLLAVEGSLGQASSPLDRTAPARALTIGTRRVQKTLPLASDLRPQMSAVAGSPWPRGGVV